MSTKYSAKIIESSRELTVEERIKFKDIGDAIKLDDVCEEAPLEIAVADYCVIAVHNEKADTFLLTVINTLPEVLLSGLISRTLLKNLVPRELSSLISKFTREILLTTRVRNSLPARLRKIY